MNSLLFLLILSLSKLPAGEPCQLKIVDVQQQGIADAHLYNPAQREQFCLTDTDGAGCCPTLAAGDSLVVQKTGYTTWRGIRSACSFLFIGLDNGLQR